MNQTMLDQEDLQAVDKKSEIDNKSLDEPKTFEKLALRQVIWIHWGIFMMIISYQCKEKQL